MSTVDKPSFEEADSARTAGGNLAGMIAIALWSSLAVLTTWTGTIPPLQLLAGCFLVAGVTGLLLPIRGSRNVADYLGRLRQPWTAFVLATLALYGYHALYFLALKTAPPVEASLVNYLWPVLIVLFSAMLPGVRHPPIVYVAVALALLGAIAVVTRFQGLALDPRHTPGYLAALAAAVIWAVYSVLNRRYAEVPSTAIALPCLAVAALAMLSHRLLETTVTPGNGEWLAMLVLGLGPAGGAFWLWDHGTKHGRLAILGTLAYAAPVLSTMWLLLAGKATPHWTQALACALIVAAGLLVMRGTRHAATE